MAVAFDTLKLAQRLEAAGMLQEQAEGVAAALAETISGDLVSREHFDDARAADREHFESARRADREYIEAARKADREYLEAARAADREYLDRRLAETKAEILKWMFGTIGFQTIIIRGAVAAFVKLLH